MFAAICAIYLALVLVLSFLAGRLEYRLNAPFRN
jgi:polar amino acid transport system permease protein